MIQVRDQFRMEDIFSRYYLTYHVVDNPFNKSYDVIWKVPRRSIYYWKRATVIR